VARWKGINIGGRLSCSFFLEERTLLCEFIPLTIIFQAFYLEHDPITFGGMNLFVIIKLAMCIMRDEMVKDQPIPFHKSNYQIKR